MLEGKKTYIGIFLTFLGWVGWGDLVSAQQLGDALNLGTQLVGIIVAVYGNYKAHQKISTLQKK